ncbi:MAG: aminoacyl-tRNA hydrolase [Tissierellales bacterium]|nr:aminoacyl-tRNA hydrolase [Tissierellales bacterium]
MYLVVGLGNPGKKYEWTRHNVGFNAIDYLSDKWGVSVKTLKHKALIGEHRINGEKVLLVKPQTFMNASGESLRELKNYYKVPIENIIVIYDDLDLDVGKLRIRPSGSAGTHNGMRSIIYQLREDQFPRIRIGIGKQAGDIIHHVMGEFSKEDRKLVDDMIELTAGAVEMIVTKDVQTAMNNCNRK